jgi:hypothetical protein
MARKPYVAGILKMLRALRRLNSSPTTDEESIWMRVYASFLSDSVRKDAV